MIFYWRERVFAEMFPEHPFVTYLQISGGMFRSLLLFKLRRVKFLIPTEKSRHNSL